jgi:DNA primase large subunit
MKINEFVERMNKDFQDDTEYSKFEIMDIILTGIAELSENGLIKVNSEMVKQYYKEHLNKKYGKYGIDVEEIVSRLNNFIEDYSISTDTDGLHINFSFGKNTKMSFYNGKFHRDD